VDFSRELSAAHADSSVRVHRESGLSGKNAREPNDKVTSFQRTRRLGSDLQLYLRLFGVTNLVRPSHPPLKPGGFAPHTSTYVHTST